MKKLTLILLLTVWSCLFSSRAEARPPLESGTHTWRQVTYGTLGLTLSVIPYVYMLEKSQPIQRRFKSENPTFLGRCVLKGLAITTVVGPFAVLELCARGIELGYRQQYGNQYRGNMQYVVYPCRCGSRRTNCNCRWGNQSYRGWYDAWG